MNRADIETRLKELSNALAQVVGRPLLLDVSWEGISDLPLTWEMLGGLVEDVAAVLTEVRARLAPVKRVWIGDGPTASVSRLDDLLVVSANFKRGSEGRLIRGALRIEIEKLLPDIATSSGDPQMKTHGIAKLIEFGQSVWYDFIKRDLLDSGELKRLIEEDGLRGMTSNPTIFEKAIAGSNLYDKDLQKTGGKDAAGATEAVMVADVQKACDLFRPLFDSSKGTDGFVSIEVSPTAANDTKVTLDDAHRLWKSVNRPNLMVKIPGTKAGLPAIRQCIAEGININVTLLFSVDRHREVMEAYIAGLEDRAKAGQPVAGVQSVASFFVSRVDTKADKALGELIAKGGANAEKAKGLLHKIAIDNAKIAYEAFEQTFTGARWQALASKGAALQRPLWASTSTKDPSLPDTLYVEALVGKHTVNTIPPETYNAYKDHGKPADRIHDDLAGAKKRLADLESLGISLAKITADLETEGVASFTKSFEALLTAVGQKSKALNVA